MRRKACCCVVCQAQVDAMVSVEERQDGCTALVRACTYAVQPDFLYSVSRDFMRTCRTPMLVLPDDVPAHPLQTLIAVASLAPNAEITVSPWSEGHVTA